MASRLIVPERLGRDKPGAKPLARSVRPWVNPQRQHAGHRPGTAPGGFIADMVALRKTILLCWRCQPKFHYRRHSYYKEPSRGCLGRCDGCRRDWEMNSKLYIPEERLRGSDGKLRPGQCWTPS